MFGLQRSTVLWWAGLSPTLSDTFVDQVVSDVDTIMQHVLRPEVIAAVPSNVPLQAVLRVAGEEIAAGMIYARWLRLPERSWGWRIGELEASPGARPPLDPGGLIERGTARLKPYLVSDPKFGPLASVFGVTGKQGGEAIS